MSAAKDQQEAQYAQLVMNDPEMRRILAAYAAMPHHGYESFYSNPLYDASRLLDKQYDARLAQLGIDKKEWSPTVKWNGNTPTVTFDHQNIIERHPNEVGALAVGGMFAAPFIAPSLVGLGGAAPTAPATLGATGGTYIPAQAVVPAGETATSASATAATTAGSTGAKAADTASKASQYIKNPYVQLAAGVGVDLAKDALENRAQNKALDATKEASDKALALQQAAADEAKRLAERQYADKAPYRNIGANAELTLAGLMGLPTTAAPAQLTSGPAPATNQGPAPTHVTTNPAPGGQGFTPDQAMINRGQMAPPPATLGNVNALAMSQTVNVRAPNQMVYAIPHDRVQEALAQGGQVVQ